MYFNMFSILYMLPISMQLICIKNDIAYTLNGSDEEHKSK